MFWETILDQRMLIIYSLIIQNGMFVGYVNGSLYRLVSELYEKEGKKLVNRNISLTMMSYGIAGVVFSNVMKNLDKKYNGLILKTSSFAFTGVMVLVFIYGDTIDSMWKIILIALVLGLVDVAHSLFISVYLSTSFSSRLEAFTLWKQIANILSSAFIFAQVLSKKHFDTFGYVVSGLNIMLTIVFVGTF